MSKKVIPAESGSGKSAVLTIPVKEGVIESGSPAWQAVIGVAQHMPAQLSGKPLTLPRDLEFEVVQIQMPASGFAALHS